ncbi:protein of unknown function (DUF2930) [Rubidibacter lacunae KORDI 51-2]|uniref:Cofactor assembly of complex C subunit B n=1 Tax=Rubidibacter lacunae KORDI 51-2 TaxID=582515 RepID=U5DC76_9CHRO|nr:cofactor assembly of complex C subunit B [Rubidibacter lacunae]ERN42128.1 protein of unknown function (DUF2930) [Rubidibacter lacunae KORDI 51-2]
MTNDKSSVFRDPNRWVRQLPLIAGTLGGILLMINRLSTLELTVSQSRSDAVGVLLSALLILAGLLWQQVQARSPESVQLQGETGFELEGGLPESARAELAWASHLLLTNTATRSLVVTYDAQVILRRGVLGPQAKVNPGPIVQRVLATSKAVYLVDLKLYPGRVEFDYLPPNTQGIICQPLGSQGVMVLAANAPRSYTRQDEAWIAGIADKLASILDVAIAASGKPD